MSSLKMTFSLTSLIFLIALGLVFVPTSVMAHDAEQSGDPATVGPHTHPVKVVVNAADADATTVPPTPAVLAVPIHGAHPTVTVSLKEDDAKVRGMEAVVTSATTGTTDVVTLVVQFDMPVANAGTTETVASTEVLDLTDFTIAIRNNEGTLITDAPTAGTVVRTDATTGAKATKFEVPLTMPASAIPSGTSGEADEKFTLKIKVNEGVVFGLQKDLQSDDGFTDIEVPGGASQASMVETFTLVKTLTPEDDTTKPTVEITSAKDATTGNVTFTLTFSESVTLTLGDLDIENGSAVDFGGSGMVWTLEVNPQASRKVTVSFKATAMVKDGSDNVLDVSAADPGVYTPADYVPTIGITAAAGTGDDADKVIFTLNFSEKPAPFSVRSLTVTGAAAPKVADLKMATMATEGYAVTYTLTATPAAAATEVMVSIAAGELRTTDTPPNFFEGATGKHTVTPKGLETAGLATGDSRETVTSEAEFALSGMLAPGAFKVFSAVANTDASSTVIAGLPNIQRFFARGGTISLVGPAGTTSKSVIITEIMWALDLAAVPAMQANKQWIEVYNTDNKNTDGKGTATPKTVNLSQFKLVFTPGTVLPTPANLADQVSNVERLGWTVDVGQSGKLGTASATFTPVDIVSMYRNFKYADLTKVHNKDDAAKNRTAQLNVIPNGNVKASWMASTVNDTYATNQLGSPGTMHFLTRDPTTATSASYAVIINEIGNNSGDAYDWIELRNTGTTEVNLKKWEITKFTKIGDEAALVSFPDNDNHKIPGGGILLVVQSDPYRNPDHPLAAGDRINGGHTVTTGINTRYYVDGGLKLADGGGFALLVRSANDKENKPDNVIDFTAPGLNNLQDTSKDFRTSQWPLRAQAAGHGDIIKDHDEKFNTGAVFQRNKANAGNAAETWTKAGYTGAGYKRSGSGNGTPGYPNNVVVDKDSVLAGDSAVTISEIMYDRGRRNNLPQWIELYNSSKTQAINLNEWKLKIENTEDVDVREPAVTIGNLGGTIIQPNQTVLIVAYTRGRVSRGSQGRDDFPSNRIINLSGKGELEIPDSVNKSNYRLLSGTAFKLTLIEKGGGMVDTVGNLGADGMAMWELPMMDNGEGRSSVIRRYNTGKATGPGVIRGSGEGMAQDGTMATSWVLASDSDLEEVRVNETFYGSPDDKGTPGYRGGGPLPVSLSKFRPERLKDTGEVVVRWITESELNNAGFNILRSEKRDGEFTKVHFEAGEGTTSERTVYEWKDTSAKPNVVYYYQIQDVSLDGEVTTLRTTHLRGNVTAAGKLTTTWAGLKALQ